MQKLFIIVVLLLNHNQEVQCDSIFQYMYDNLIGLKESILSSFDTIQTNLRKIVLRTMGPDSEDITPRRRQHRHVLSSLTLPARFTEKSPKCERLDHTCNYSSHAVTTPQLSAIDGRIMETHVTQTLDGYILTLHRLHSSQTECRRERRTVLLHHGLLGSSADWILLGTNKSLPYILSDAGHDVWLANSRGNYYSRTHVSTEENSEKYWNFSWQEIGEYDIPATLDYIRKTKNSTDMIDYIGHSMGATALLVLLSAKSNYNNYFRIAILLAPLVHMSNTKGPLRVLAAMDKTELLSFLGTREYMPDRTTSPILVSKICGGFEDLCKHPLFFLTGSPLQNGINTKQFNNELLKYVPAGGSTKTIIHYLQLIKNRHFHHYGKPNKIFELKFVDTPTLIISSNDDPVSDVNDNQILFLSLMNPIGHIIIKDKNLSHNEFAWGSNAENLFYYKIRDLIDTGPDVNEIF